MFLLLSYSDLCILTCCWLRPTTDQPTVNRFVATLDEGHAYVCTIKNIEAAKTTIETLKLTASLPFANWIAINSTNSILCIAAGYGEGLRLVDLGSGEEVLKIDAVFKAVQFDPNNPHTLFAYQSGKGCCKVDPALPHMRQRRTSEVLRFR